MKHRMKILSRISRAMLDTQRLNHPSTSAPCESSSKPPPSRQVATFSAASEAPETALACKEISKNRSCTGNRWNKLASRKLEKCAPNAEKNCETINHTIPPLRMTVQMAVIRLHRLRLSIVWSRMTMIYSVPWLRREIETINHLPNLNSF